MRFVMVCTLKVASDEEPVQRGVKRSRDLPDGLCYVVLDDDKITRLLARKQIAKFGPHPSSVVLGESRQEALSVPERVCTLADELGEENIIVILDQNLNYPDGDVLGTDLASTLRRNQYGGPIVKPTVAPVPAPSAKPTLTAAPTGLPTTAAPSTTAAPTATPATGAPVASSPLGGEVGDRDPNDDPSTDSAHRRATAVWAAVAMFYAM